MEYLQVLSKKLNVPIHKINKDTIKYYYTKWPELCCRYNLEPIDTSVGPYEYSKAINIMNQYYKEIQSDYYRNLYEECKKYKDGESVLGNETNEMLDHIIGEYIRFRPNTFVITLWPNANDKLNELLKILHDNGHVYYIKKFNLHYDAAKNLIYQMYSDTHRLSDIESIENKLSWIGWEKDKISSFKIIIFDHQSKIPISGSMSPLKQQIREIWTKDNSSKRGDDFVHINDHFYQTYEYTRLFFNKNSMMALHFQDLNSHLSKNFGTCRIYLNTIKNWITKNISPIDYDRFMFMSSTVLYIYGIRVCRDVDGFVSGKPMSKDSKTPFLEEKLRKNFYDKHTKFFFADIGMPGTKLWKDRWDDHDKPWFDIIGIKYRDQLIFDPEQYFWYNGMKFVTIKNDVRRRILRRKVTDYGDLMEIERKTNIEIEYPIVPDEYSKEEFEKLLKEYMSEKYKNNNTYIEKLKILKFSK